MRRLLCVLLISAAAYGQQVNQDIIPANTGLNIGRSNQRWNGFFQNLDILGTCSVNGSPCQTLASSPVNTGTSGAIAVYSGTQTIVADPNIDDGATTPGVITVDIPVAAPQFNVTGTGGLGFASPGGPLLVPLPLGANGGVGIAAGGIPSINPSNGGWFPISYVSANSTASTVNNTNHNDTTPAAPANGINVKWQLSGANLSAYILGDGNAAHALCGTGVFGTCTSGGATAVSGLTPATGANTTANGNFPQTFNFAQTTDAQTAWKFGETSAATGGTYTSGVPNQTEVTISTAAGSTASPLLVSNSLTGSQTACALCITPTWNTSGVVDAALLVNVTNTASANGSNFADFQVSGSSKFSVDKSGNVSTTSAYGGAAASSNINFCGGNAAQGCSSNNTNGLVGSAIYQGGDDNNTGSSAKAGVAIFRGGILTSPTPNAAALEGTVQLGAGYLKGSTVAAVGDIVCGTTTAFTVTDCSHTGPAVNIVGIATSTSTPVGVVSAGTALVKTDGAVTIGDILCMGVTTDGQAHDNGTGACATAGTTIGVVIATSGTITQMSGNSTAAIAMSTTLPLVALHK